MSSEDVKTTAGEPSSEDPLAQRLRSVNPGFEVDLAAVGRGVRARRHRRLATAVVATIACALIGGGLVIAIRDAGQKAAVIAATAARCPASAAIPGLIGDPERATSEAERRLVPQAAPTSAVLCSYQDPTPSHGTTTYTTLTWSRQITSGFSRMPTDLNLARNPYAIAMSCPPEIDSGRSLTVLVLGYAGRTVSLTQGDGACRTSWISNGSFYLTAPGKQRTLETAVQNHRWVGVSSVNAPCAGDGLYRNPGTTRLDPGEPVSIRLCTANDTGVLLNAQDRQAILRELKDAPIAAVSSRQACGSPDRALPNYLYTLTLGYAEGPALVVRVGQACSSFTPRMLPSPGWDTVELTGAPVVDSPALVQAIESRS